MKTNNTILILISGLVLLISSCKPNNKQNMNALPFSENFQHDVDGKHCDLFILKSHTGITAAITNYGGRLVSLLVPDSAGKAVDVVAGFDGLDGYINSKEPYYGALIGRYGNRIAGGTFKIDGRECFIKPNNGPNVLHGGKTGFQYKVWDAAKLSDSVLVLTYRSKDMEEGFPGNLTVKVTYELNGDNLELNYFASTDQPTVVNLTNHAFFNLNGSGSILDHQLMINANTYTPVDATLIPTGAIEPVKGTPFDFRISKSIGTAINEQHPQLAHGKGYDHNYVLNSSKMMPAASVTGDKSGITMEVFTTEPGLQFYSGNFMHGENVLRTGPDEFRTAFCLETQHFPDSPNHTNFPSTVLRPGEKYESKTVYSFSRQ